MSQIPKLIIDCDPGHDDAIALLLAHGHAEVIGITTVSGNAPLEATTRNALAIAALAGSDAVVCAGAESPYDGHPRHATHIHGEDGLGGLELPAHDRVPDSRGAVDFLLDATAADPGIWIVPIGPLTNIAHAMEADPSFETRIAGISLMGGSATMGNVTAVAEFNVWADPEAAEIVFRSGAEIRMCGLNLTHQLQTDDALVERLRRYGSPRSQFSAAVFEYLHDRMETLIGARASALHDPCAVLAITHPELVSFEPRSVVVETAGRHTRGMTVVDERRSRDMQAANVAVGYGIDAERAMDVIVDALER